MWPSIIGLFAFVLLVVIIGILFAGAVISLVVNGAIIYLVGLRAFKEIDKGWFKEYGIGAGVALALVLLAGNVVPFLWGFTTWLALAFVVAQLAHLIMKK
jgi:hypothetical protein